MIRPSPRTLCALVGLCAPVAAQDVLPFPLQTAGRDADHGQLVAVPDAGTIAALTARSSVSLDGVPLADGQLVRVDLERVPLAGLELGFQVDGVPAPGLLDGLALSIWKGRVHGDASSEVLLSFSNAGNRGWVTTGGEMHHFMPQPGSGGDWSRGHSVVVDQRTLDQLGVDLGMACGADAIPRNVLQLDEIPTHGLTPKASGAGFYECPIAIETDYQLFQVLGSDLGAETAYVTTLLAAASDRYVEQIDTRLTYPYVQFHTTSNDGWTSGDLGGSSIDMLNEFVGAWSGAPLPGDATVGHFLSGAGLGGGVAYLSVLCDTNHDFSFAVSGNIDGDTPFPIDVGPLNWDFVVFTHETGHNFSSPHTHDYCDPIDECAPAGYWGACQDETLCISDGSIMSYCHLCPGGLSNVTTYFHPTVVGVMREHVAACVAPVALLAGVDLPQFVAPDVPTPLTASLVGTPTGPVNLHYRFDPLDAFQIVAMTDQGGGVYEALLPAATCSDQPEFFFSTTEQEGGVLTTAASSATVGIQSVAFADDFEADLGWTVGDLGDDATTGIWERVDPNGTTAQPESGVDAGATGPFCYVTGQSAPGAGIGDNDIDGGKTTLFSPVLDLSSGDNAVGYWRWYSNDTGASPNNDVFVVDVSNDGATWVNVETVGPGGPDTSGGWIYHEFVVSDYVTPTSTVLVRFVASDEGDGSVVEAGLDGFEVFSVACEVCQPDLGFGGPGTMTMSLCGDELATGGSASLDIAGGPAGTSGLIVFGPNFGPVPVADGILVPFPFVAFTGFTTDGTGAASLPVSGGKGPVTLYLQAAAFDGGSGQFWFSNAIEAEFLP